MANVFGTPVYLYSADDPGNRSKDGKDSVSGRLKEILRTLQPLEKALGALENATKALEGTSYEDIQNGIQQLVQQITAKTQEAVSQLSEKTQTAPQQTQTQGSPQAAQQAAQQNQNFIPTAGQISGSEPLPPEV